MRTFLRIIIGSGLGVAALAVVAPAARAHTRIKLGSSLVPRSESSGLKSAPCGAVAPTTDPLKRTTLNAGEDLLVSWEETVQHPGYFRIAFSPDGVTAFDTNVLMDNISDTQDGPVDSGKAETFHQYSKTVKVPGVNCETCAIQVIQVMTENPAAPTRYYSCADVKIVGGTEPPPPPPAPPAPTPAPAPATSPASGSGSGAATGSTSAELPATTAPLAPTGLKLQISKSR